MAFVMRLLGWKTEQNGRALTERDQANDDVRSGLSLLTATLDSTADGIVVVNAEGKIVQFNSRFVEMLRLPEAVLASGNDHAAIDFVADQRRRPENFLAKIEEFDADPEAESSDTLEFKDRRAFERQA